MPRLGPFSLLVRDYDEAIDWYTRVLGFRLLVDDDQGHKRWVVVEGDGGGSLVLAGAKNASEQARTATSTAVESASSSRSKRSTKCTNACLAWESNSRRNPASSRTARSPCSATSTAIAGT